MSDARTVLIVEDDVAFADFLRAAVESVGHRAIVVTNAMEALPAFAKHRPDFLLIDILLPKGDGFEVCKSIRAHEGGADVPIVLMTGIYKKASYERQGLMECRATEYVHKPFGVQALWRMLENHLGAVTGDAEPEQPAECADLASQPLVDILAQHVANDSNGVLFVRSRGTTYAIYLQWGEPVFIRSNDPADRLVEVLRRSGQVTLEQVEGALQALTESRGRLRLGQALVRRGVLSEDQFQVSLQLQLRLIFQHAFQLTEGTCSFIQGSHPTEEDVHLAIRPKALLLLGAKATSAQGSIAANLPPDETRLVRSVDFAALQEELALKPPERAIAQLVDGTLTAARFRAIAEAVGADGSALLHGFLLTGLIETGEREDAPALMPPCHDWDATSFSQLPVAAAIADLHRIGASGTLEVRAVRGGPAKRLVFRAGELAAVQSDVEEDRLSDMLVRLRLITETDLSELVHTFGGVEPDDRALARGLVDSGQVLPLQVYWAAIYQAQAAVHGLFCLVGAKLSWMGGEEPHGTVGLPDMPTGEIVLGAVRSLAAATLLALLPPKTAWFRARGDAKRRAGAMPLNDDERALLERLAEPVRLGDLLAEQPQAKAEIRRRVHGLLSCRLVSEAAAPSVSGPLEDDADAEELDADTTDFLDMLHEDGFATGRTGQHAAITESEVEQSATPDLAESVNPTAAAEDAADAADLLTCSFVDEDDDVVATAPERGDAVSRSRELLARIAAGRAALEPGEQDLATHREALSELLAQCEALAKQVLEEAHVRDSELETVASGGGSER